MKQYLPNNLIEETMQEKMTWVLFDKSANKKTPVMGTLQAQMVIMTLPVKNIENIYIWAQGWSQWKKLTEYLSSNQKYFIYKKQANGNVSKETITQSTITEINEETQSAIYFTDTVFTEVILTESNNDNGSSSVYNDFNGDDLKIEDVLNVSNNPKISFNSPDTKVSQKERRDSERHNFKIEFLIANKNGNMFRSYTKNISLSGAMLEKPIPKDILTHPMDLIIINKFEKDPQKGKLHFKGKVVGNLTDPARLNFINVDSNTVKRLQEMLESYLNKKSELQKNKKAV